MRVSCRVVARVTREELSVSSEVTFRTPRKKKKEIRQILGSQAPLTRTVAVQMPLDCTRVYSPLEELVATASPTNCRRKWSEAQSKWSEPQSRRAKGGRASVLARKRSNLHK